MTAVGVTGYLFHLEEYVLSFISMIVFGKLIIFHFVMEYFDRKNSNRRLSKYGKNKIMINL
jgi:hypothetical protein